MKMDLSTLLKLFSLCYCMVLASADDCVQKSPCSCVFPNGTGIDLAPSARNTMYISNTLVEDFNIIDSYWATWNRTYYFHPCYNVPMPTDLNPLLLGECASDVSICFYYGTHDWLGDTGELQHTLNNTQDYHYDFAGSAFSTYFAPNGSYIEYPLYPKTNYLSSTVVHLVCDDTDDSLVILRLSTLENYKAVSDSTFYCRGREKSDCRPIRIGIRGWQSLFTTRNFNSPLGTLACGKLSRILKYPDVARSLKRWLEPP